VEGRKTVGLKTGEALEQELSTREWPAEVKDAIIGDYDKSPYVREGRVFTRALRLHQMISEPIPAGESAVTSLCTGDNGIIYGATSGRRSHLFYYDPSPLADSVVDLGVLPGVLAARRTIAAAPGFVFVGASEIENPAEGGAIFVHETEKDASDEFRATKGPTRKLIVPVQGEGIAALCCDSTDLIVYGVSSVTGTFFSYDYREERLELHGAVSKDKAFSRCLVMDGVGHVYGTHSLGTLFRFNIFFRSIEDLGVKIPTVAGREFYNQLDSGVHDPHTRRIYGGGTADGVLFWFDPDTLETRSLGKVIAEPRVRAIATAPDGRIFGVAGCEDGMGHLFVHDPKRCETRDLGLMFAASEIWRRGFEFDAACTGPNGEIYFGESEREGHLFMYFPAYPQKVSPQQTRTELDIPF